MTKCQYIFFLYGRHLNIRIYIDRVETVNFHGVTLNQHMNWESHSNILSNTIACAIGICNRLKHFIPLLVKRLDIFQFHLWYIISMG